MTRQIGRLQEVLGTVANDRIRSRNRQIAYGRSGNDRLTATADPLLGARSATLLVGGFGDDTYIASRNGLTAILDAGSDSDSNKLVASGIGVRRETSFVMDIDGRHLLAADTDSNQIVIALDWRRRGNRLKTVELADGEYGVDSLGRRYRSFPGYLGNFSWKELQDNRVLDLGQVGLSPSSVNRAIQDVMTRTAQL